jgi:hypothetical protein
LSVVIRVRTVWSSLKYHQARCPQIAMLFNSSPQRVENDVINRKLDSYNMVSVVVRICTVQGFLWYLQADYPSLTMFCHASTQRIDNCSGVHR